MSSDAYVIAYVDTDLSDAAFVDYLTAQRRDGFEYVGPSPIQTIKYMSKVGLIFLRRGRHAE